MTTIDHGLTKLVDQLGAHRVSERLAFADIWDGGDVWGSALAEGFVLCDWLTFELGRRDLVPGEMHYVPALAGPDDESYEYDLVREMWPGSELTPEDVGEYLRLLGKTMDVCTALGLNY